MEVNTWIYFEEFIWTRIFYIVDIYYMGDKKYFETSFGPHVNAIDNSYRTATKLEILSGLEKYIENGMFI